MGLFEAAGELTVIEPLYVPADSPVGFAETFSASVVVPLGGDTVSQLPPEVEDAEAVMLSGPPVLEINTCWDCGVEPPIW